VKTKKNTKQTTTPYEKYGYKFRVISNAIVHSQAKK